ncbi:hypothetical protein [Williamwhitmania taraxaci]|uniref:Uncharacterized protein n=1 Tax=Williamwhitmania taraxaci TaxID=1640674 RepID=A0A1G6SEX8_9BACT|nr:hypothetical protein [Williamwhitmania taraxaci]SDD15432.1 hypothetical protein SAMN05216323_10939 [Williamwhitmania taraxaci]
MDKRITKGLTTVKSVYIVATIALIVLIYILIDEYNEVDDRKRNSQYTIGLTIKIVGTAKSGNNVFYSYKVNGIQYDGLTHIGYNDYFIIPNGRYYVVYSSKHPDNGEMLIHNPVPYAIQQAPPEGWNSIPVPK